MAPNAYGAFCWDFLVSCFFFVCFLHNMCELLTVTSQIPFETELLCVTLGKNITQVIAGLATPESLSTLWHLPLLTERTTSWFSLSCSLCIFCCASKEMDCLVFLSWGCLSICNPIELSWRYVGLWCRCIGNHWKRVQWELIWSILSVSDASMLSSCKPVCPWRCPPI